MKRFRGTEAWKWIRTILQFVVATLVILALIHACRWVSDQAHAEKEPEVRWVFCKDILLVREGPKKSFQATGELEPGTMVFTDGKIRNGFCHLVNLANESGDGWVKNIYLIGEEPECVNCTATVISKGRLAARRNVGGERIRWLKPNSIVTVYMVASEWCVTDCGYVMSKYLELE